MWSNPQNDLTMLNLTVSSVQLKIALRQLTFKNMYYLCMI